MVQVLEYVLFGTVIATNLCLGLYFSFRKAPPSSGSASPEAEMFLGSRALRVLPLAASAVASMMSSTGLIAFPAHFYAYGMHMLWGLPMQFVCLPLATHVVVPVIYKLGVTSIFEYLRLRFNTAISLTACAIYIFLTQSIGAISIFAASLTLVTVFNAPLFWSNVFIGLCGTFYTALGGLRGVVWMDCVQLVVILVAPAALVAKVTMDALSENSSIQPLTDFNVKQYVGDFSLDFTNDENVWSVVWGGAAFSLYRLCFDQVVVQRQLASRTLQEARRTALSSTALMVVQYLIFKAMGFVLIVWFRGCDPGLLGDIKSIDQMIPYYINKYLTDIPGFSGLFLAGVVCAATSTVSSIINSQAAILYVDIIAPRYKKAKQHVLWITRSIAFFVGTLMTLYSTLCVHMGSLTTVFMMANSAFAAPYVGLCLLAVLFPFVHSKGAGTATLLMAVYQVWHMVANIASGKRPARMPVSLEYCPANFTTGLAATNGSRSYRPKLVTRSEDIFFIFRLSFFWSSFFAILGTVLTGILVSAVTGEMRSKTRQPHLTSDALMQLWRKCRWSSQQSNRETLAEGTVCINYPMHQAESGKLLNQEVETVAC